MENRGQRAGEFGIRHGVGRGGVQGSMEALLAEGKLDQSRPIVDVNPGHPLPAGAQAPAHSPPERGKHAGQRPAVAEHDANA